MEAYEDKYGSMMDSNPHGAMHFADSQEPHSQQDLENEALEEIEIFASEQNTRFISIELQMDLERKTNQDFFQRLRDMKDDGRVPLHTLTVTSDDDDTDEDADEFATLLEVDGPTNKGIHARMKDVKEHLVMLMKGEDAGKVNNQQLLRQLCSLDIMYDRFNMSSFEDLDGSDGVTTTAAPTTTTTKAKAGLMEASDEAGEVPMMSMIVDSDGSTVESASVENVPQASAADAHRSSLVRKRVKQVPVSSDTPQVHPSSLVRKRTKQVTVTSDARIDRDNFH
jgi:hypothetical protein